MLMLIQLIILESSIKNLKIFKHCANIDAVNMLITVLPVCSAFLTFCNFLFLISASFCCYNTDILLSDFVVLFFNFICGKSHFHGK